MTVKSLMALLLVFAAGIASAAERTPEQTFTYSLLTDDALGDVVMGAKAVERNPGLAPDVLDVVAAVLLERSANPSTSAMELDTSAWLMRALGAGHQARHRAAIEQATKAYQHKKIDKYAEAALEDMTRQDPAPSVGIDLMALRGQLQAERDAMQATNTAVASYALGTPLETVLRDQGYPPRTSRTMKTAGYRYVQVTLRALRLHYPDLGMIDIGNGSASGRSWVVTRFWPKLGDAYTGDYLFEAMALVNGNDRELSDVAHELVTTKVREPQLLDLAEARIRQSMATRFEHEVQGLAYLCRLLGASGDRKYVDVLRKAAEDGADGGLRRHARRGLDELIGSP